MSWKARPPRCAWTAAWIELPAEGEEEHACGDGDADDVVDKGPKQVLLDVADDGLAQIQELSGLGIEVVMLTGDNAKTAQAIQRQVGVDMSVTTGLPWVIVPVLSSTTVSMLWAVSRPLRPSSGRSA